MRKTTSRAAVLSMISGLARAPGFLIPLLIASHYGAGAQTDAYFIAYSAALLVGGTIAQGIEVAIVPFSARAITRGRLTGMRFLDHTSVRTTQIAALLWLVALPLAVAMSEGGLRSQVAVYGACFAPLVLLWTTSAVYAGGLVSMDAIGLATGSALFRGLGGILALVLAPRGLGLAAVALGIGGGELVRAWWLRTMLLKGLPTTGADVPSAGERFGWAAAAQVMAGVAGGTAPVAERFIAASLGVGAVSRLEYASRLLVIPGLLFDGALAPLLLSRWSQRVAARGELPSRREVVRTVAKGLMVAVAVAIGVYGLAGVVVQLLLRHGRFSDGDAAAVTSLLRLLAVGYVGSMGALLLERYYLASARNRLLAALSIGRVGLRVVTALLVLSPLGLQAFGIGFAAAEYAYLLALLFFLPASPAVVAEIRQVPA